MLRQFIAPRSAGEAALNASRRTGEEIPSAPTTHAVALNQKASPLGTPGRVAFDELRLEALLVQGGRQAKPGDSSADNQNPFDIGHQQF
jgi:hypothetical protein